MIILPVHNYATRSKWDASASDEDWKDVKPVDDKSFDKLISRAFVDGWEVYLYVYQRDGELVCYYRYSDPAYQVVEIPEG